MRVDSPNTWLLPAMERGVDPRATVPKDPSEGTSAAPAAPAPKAAPQAAKGDGAGDADTGGEKSMLERILESGFSQFAADLEKEKLAQMREEILGAMGLTEEMLQHMTPEQRKQIEDMVAAEIRKRLEAASAVNNGGEDAKGSVEMGGKSIGANAPAVAASKADPTAPASQHSGLGVMLALQEIAEAKAENANTEEIIEPGKKDREAL